jgi:hypothetical protein
LVSEIRRFTRVTIATAKTVVENPDEPADPVRGGGLADWAMLTRHTLRIELGKFYRQTIDLLSEMPGVLNEIGLTRLPHFTVLRDWFEKLPTPLWRAFLRSRRRNAPAMRQSIPLVSTATSPHGTTLNERTTASVR